MTAQNLGPDGAQKVSDAGLGTHMADVDGHHAEGHDHTTGDGSGVLTNDEHDGYSKYSAIADPGAAATGAGRLYFKDVSGRILPKFVGAPA